MSLRSPRRTAASVVCLVALAAATLTACNRPPAPSPLPSSQPASPSATVSAQPHATALSSTATPSASTPTDESDDASAVAWEHVDSSHQASQDSPSSSPTSVMAIRTATHEGFDRIVVDISNESDLGWFASLNTEAFTAGKGEPVTLDGSLILTVSFYYLDWLQNAPGAITERTSGHDVGPAIKDFEYVPPFEGQADLFVGIEGKEYRVFLLHDPARLVIDVKHP